GIRDRNVTGVQTCALPISMIHYASTLLSEKGLKGGIFGHVGDGNFHTLLTFQKENNVERNQAFEINELIVNRAIEVGGTCTGEHGVGLGKRRFQEKEHGDALDIMRSIKKMLDPEGILNPGKIF